MVEIIAGLATYIARPTHPHTDGQGGSPRKVILFFADVFGPLYINSKLAMDYWADNGEGSDRQPRHGDCGDRLMHLARAGFLVLGPDYFEGDSCAHHQSEPGWVVDEWVVPFRTSAAQVTPPWIETVRKQYDA